MRCPALLLLALLALPAPALAHDVRYPRMVQLRMLPERFELAVAWVIHKGPEAAHLRGRFDRDGDGQLQAAEQDLLAAWIQSRVDRSLALELDGEALRTEVGTHRLELDRDASARSEDGMRYASTAAVALTMLPGGHDLVLKDRPDRPERLVPWRVDLLPGLGLEGVEAEGEATPLTMEAPGVLAAGGFTGQGGAVTLRFQVPPRGAPAAREGAGAGDGAGLGGAGEGAMEDGGGPPSTDDRDEPLRSPTPSR